MTFDAREKSRYSGQPVECYRFAQGGSLWLYTSADKTIVLPAGTFTPETIQRQELDFSQEQGAGNLVIVLARSNPVSQLFVGFLPPTPVNVTLYRTHRGDSEVVAPFTGLVSSFANEGLKTTLTCSPIERVLRRHIPILAFQSPCNWALYSGNCGVSKFAFRDSIIVTSVSGLNVVSSTFAARADGWYTGGYAEDVTGAVRFITSHVGNTISLMSPFVGLASGQTISAYAGCDRTETTCNTKFGNLVNHLGFARVPQRNPYDGSL